GTTPVSVAPMAVSPPSQPELPVAQLVNYTNLELPVSLEAGPSGVKSMDLYVTRDDGRSWQRLSQHDGRDTNLKVNLRPRNETNVDGVYGFRIVATSGAGLSDELPRSGTVPEMRVQVDMTPPVITIYEPTTEPNQKDLLMLNWQVTDKNMGKAPVALEWSEGPSGPWKPCAGNSSVQQVAVVGTSTDAGANRVPNTGKFGWKVPTNLGPTGVYLRVTAWDDAGNKSEVATPRPVPVDLVKPRARLQGTIQPTPR
ncbi:MAG: hypothetical protein ACRCZF_04250, partial [Gemmataceae bacterium]